MGKSKHEKKEARAKRRVYLELQCCSVLHNLATSLKSKGCPTHCCWKRGNPKLLKIQQKSLNGIYTRQNENWEKEIAFLCASVLAEGFYPDILKSCTLQQHIKNIYPTDLPYGGAAATVFWNAGTEGRRIHPPWQNSEFSWYYLNLAQVFIS